MERYQCRRDAELGRDGPGGQTAGPGLGQDTYQIKANTVCQRPESDNRAFPFDDQLVTSENSLVIAFVFLFSVAQPRVSA